LIEPLELDPVTGEPKTTCYCGLGYILDNSTANFPITGTCEDLRTRACTKTENDYCITNTEGWGVCPYCRAFKFQNDYGGILSLGEYVSGEGIYDSDPMVFTGGDPINCGNGADRSSIAYWYCWYTAFPSPDVPLDEIFVLWSEDPLCSYQAYIYWHVILLISIIHNK